MKRGKIAASCAGLALIALAGGGLSGCAINGAGTAQMRGYPGDEADIVEIRAIGLVVNTMQGRSVTLGYARDVYLAPPGSLDGLEALDSQAQRADCAPDCSRLERLARILPGVTGPQMETLRGGLRDSLAVDRVRIGAQLGLDDPAYGLTIGADRIFMRRVEAGRSSCSGLIYQTGAPHRARIITGEELCDIEISPAPR